jgi:hypothetical protein
VKPAFLAATFFVIALTGCSDARKTGAEEKDLPQQNDEEKKDSWVQITSMEGHFTSWFPSKPKHTLPSGDLVHQYVAETMDGTIAFYVRYTAQADTTISLDERLATTRTVMKSTNAKIIPVTICGHPAKEMSHEYVYDGYRASSRQRIVYARGAMYQLIVVALKPTGIPEEDTRRFYAGFQLLTP